MMAKVMELSGLIYGKYSNQSELAASLGWTRQRLNKIVNGRKDPDLDEVAALADKLGQSVGEMVTIFLRSKSPNGQHQ